MLTAAHVAAVNRRRRIPIQYDAADPQELFGTDMQAWLQYRFDYLVQRLTFNVQAIEGSKMRLPGTGSPSLTPVGRHDFRGKCRTGHVSAWNDAEGQARCNASPAPSGWPSALNPSWKATVPCGVCPSKDRAKKTSGGTPSSTSPCMFLNPNFL